MQLTIIVTLSLLPLTFGQDLSSSYRLYESFNFPHLEIFTAFLDSVNSTNVSRDCLQSLLSFSQGLKERRKDAMIMFDCFPKGLAGFTANRKADFGRYQNCLDAIFEGGWSRYVLINLQWPKSGLWHASQVTQHFGHFFDKQVDNIYPMESFIGVCVPSTCLEKDIKSIFKNDLNTSLTFEVASTQVNGEDPYEDFLFSRIASRVVIAAILGWVLLVTIASHFITYFESWKILRCFDARRNWLDLTGHVEYPDERLAFFNWGRFFFLVAAIFYHFHIPHCVHLGPIIFPGTKSAYDGGYFASISLGTVFVSLAFIMSGALNALNNLDAVDVTRLPLIVIHRYLRLAPVIFLIWILQVGLPITSGPGGGPLFPLVMTNVTRKCLQAGWKDLVMMGNDQPWYEMCQTVGWFMGIDFRLFIGSLFLLKVTRRRRNIGYIMMAMMVVGGMVVHALYLHYHRLRFAIPLIPFVQSDFYQQLEHGYMDTTGYIASYGLGLLFGCHLHATMSLKDAGRRISFSAISILTMTISFVHHVLSSSYDREGPTISRPMELALGVIVRPLIGLGAIFHTYFIAMRNEVIIVGAKSRFITFISRILYPTFLVHPIIVTYIHSSMDQIEDVNLYTMLLRMLSLLPLSTVAGLAVSLLVEMPFRQLSKVMIGKPTLLKIKRASDDN